MCRTPDTKVESGFEFWLREGRELDGDLWLAPLAPLGVKSVDFLVQRIDGQLWFVEAKQTSPKPRSAGGRPGEFQTWLDDLLEKYARSVEVTAAMGAGREPHPKVEQPPWLTELKRAPWRLVLVLPEHPTSALPQIRDALRARCRRLMAVFGVKGELKVLNRELAARLALGPAAE